jgi:nucleoside-diphosphate-sugar epimerase
VVYAQKEEMINSNKIILVIGGTGMLGKPVAQQLKADGFTIRLLTPAI